MTDRKKTAGTDDAAHARLQQPGMSGGAPPVYRPGANGPAQQKPAGGNGVGAGSPSVYRPGANRLVQQKPAGGNGAGAGSPSVYRPGANRLVQQKPAGGNGVGAGSPPVYRPGANRLVQQKPAGGNGVGAGSPPVYRPGANRLMQQKPAGGNGAGAGSPPVYRPGANGPARPANRPNLSGRLGAPPVYRAAISTPVQPKMLPFSGGYSPPKPGATAGARTSAPVVQRLRLTQAGTDIAEDNDTLKAQYFAAKAAGHATDLSDIMALQATKAAAWKEENDRGMAEAVERALAAGPVAEPAVPVLPAPAPVVALVPGQVKMSTLNKAPFQGATPGQRYIRWKSGQEYPHTSITFRVVDKGETAQITGMHASLGKTDTHFWWNNQSPPGTFHLSTQGGAKYTAEEVGKFPAAGLESLARAWAKVEKHARKVNCTAAKPPGT